MKECDPMQFSVAPEIFTFFPGLRLAVAVAWDLDNASDRPSVEVAWREAWADAARASVYGNAQSHPRVRPWRERFQALGVSGKQFPSSIEALLRRALKGGAPFAINPLVDWYNALSLRHVVPAGGFDLDDVEALGGPLELRLTRAGDSFTALDAQTPELVPPGEAAYAAGQTVLTRHFVWRQARASLIVRETRDVFLVSEILGEAGAEAAEAMRAEFAAGLRDHFGVTPQTWLVDAAHLQIAW
jgi:DNA/RNA-binding domain of Phe-tRNA-synthetase-like protein